MVKVHLRAFEPKDIDIVIGWVNDNTVTRTLSDLFIYPISKADELKWLESISVGNLREKIFAIATENLELIGIIGLHNINWIDRKAELGMLIGEKSFWNKGYGTAAVKAILALAFEKMNLNKIFLRVFDYNQSAIHIYQKCGFQQEGLLREDHYYGNSYCNTLIMGLLKKEYFHSKNLE